MVYVFAALALLIVFVVLSRAFSSGKKSAPAADEKQAAAADDDDEYLIDPKTGKRITLEQAMEGYEVEEGDKDKIIPEADPEQEYTEEEIAVLRIQRWMMLESFGLVTKEELSDLLEQFKSSSIRKAYEENLEYLFASQPDPGLYLVITKLAPELGHSRQGGQEGEHQLLGILQLGYAPGDALMQPKQAMNSISTAFTPEKEVLTEKNVLRLAHEHELEQLLPIDAALEGLTNYIAEIQGDYLLIKSNNPATAEEADDLLNCLRSIRRNLMD